MNAIDRGCSYRLAAGNRLVFVRKTGDLMVQDGTTNEEVLEVLIHRATEAYATLPCLETIRALYLLREALAAFRTRSARRVSAGIEGSLLPHCPIAEAPEILFGTPISRELGTLDDIAAH
jgi:hypothetical protein